MLETMPTILLDIASPLSITVDTKVYFVPIAMSESALGKALGQYEEELPEMFAQSCLQGKMLMAVGFAGYDVLYYWITMEKQ